MSKKNEEFYTLTFQIPVNEMGVSKDGLWFNLPFRAEGEMSHGDKSMPIFISKGKVLVPTAKGRESYKGKAKTATVAKADISNLM
tara:strand:+ start:260 stop:514 length:255 start_codon:yes stop_codon:yes gene_type:complete